MKMHNSKVAACKHILSEVASENSEVVHFAHHIAGKTVNYVFTGRSLVNLKYSRGR